MKFKNEVIYLKKYLKENNLDDKHIDKYFQELEKGRPIQYIIGNVNFYGNVIKVNENVLIPRFETELLVDKTIKKIQKEFDSKTDILDLGTGSGCIAVSLKKKLNCIVDAIDISNEALKVATQNAKDNDTDINFIKADMTTYKEKKYDVIISNPPYIAYNEKIMPIVKNNEPEIALYADNDGIYFYEQIIKNIKYITKEKYLIAFEIGNNQSTKIVDIANKYLTNINISVEKDYNNCERFIFITSKN